jgi:hypothetical protein
VGFWRSCSQACILLAVELSLATSKASQTCTVCRAFANVSERKRQYAFDNDVASSYAVLE